MAEGTIHGIDDALFLIEGAWPSRPQDSSPGPAVLRCDDRLYLLDTGAGPRLRRAVRAVATSFGRSAEITVINSGRHPGLIGNNDLLEVLVADRRRRLTLPDEVGSTARARLLPVGGAGWPGLDFDDGAVVALEAALAGGRFAFYLPDHRTLLLPDELCLTPGWPGSEPSDVLQTGTRALALLDTGVLDVVGLGFGPPLSAGDARTALADLVRDTAGTVGPGGTVVAT